MTGGEMKQILDNCNDQCESCKLYRPNQKHKCVKDWCAAYYVWADKQHMEINLDEKQR